MIHPSSSLAIYIHWPFCKSKCPYCDFNSHVREHIDATRWQYALLAELAYIAAWMPNQTVTSIFFGGGTPSLMPPECADALIEAVKKYWRYDTHLEITLEANPTSVEADKLAAFKAAGINRISMGIQSLRDDVLAFLGREHSAKEALAALEVAASLFDRYNFDLIYARPEQSLRAWEAELKEALTYAKGHLSLYQLTIEPNTAFHHAYHQKQAFTLPTDDEGAALYELTQEIMDAARMPAYEISNHAAFGHQSQHNLAYWRSDPYLGIGAGAHGRAYMNGAWHATHTLKSPERWLEQVEKVGHGLEKIQPLSEKERMCEAVMMGLRLNEGLALEPVNEVLNMAAFDMLQANGLLRLEDNRLYTTSAGRLLLNSLTEKLLMD